MGGPSTDAWGQGLSVVMVKEKCPDCHYCQGCSAGRCRLCKRDGHGNRACTLGPAFTYAAYLEWKKIHESGPGDRSI